MNDIYIYLFCSLIILIIIYKNYIGNNNKKLTNFLRYQKINHKIYGKIYTFGETDLISKLVSTKENNVWEDKICHMFAENYIPNTDVLDIGANIGLNSIRMNQLNPITEGNKIHMFEPQHDVFTLLEYNTKQLPRVLYNFALSDSCNILNFSPVESNMGGTSMVSNENANNVHILSTKLDNIKFDRPVSVVKLDVEGGEAGTLIGGTNFFNTHKPILIIEIWKDKLNEVLPILAGMNYVQIWNENDDFVYKHISKK